jgi:hypothetical protein
MTKLPTPVQIEGWATAHVLVALAIVLAVGIAIGMIVG